MGQHMPKQQKVPRGQLQGLRRMTSFDENEIQEWYQEFLDCVTSSSSCSPRQRQSMLMTSDVFVNTYSKIFPGSCDEFASHVFRTFDLNGDQRLDFREFLTGMSFSGSDDLTKRLAWAFRLYDVDHSGYITLDNMTGIIKAVFKMLGPRVLRYKSTTVTPETLAQQLFSQMDKDGDGRVCWAEFEEGVTTDPTAMELLQLAPPDDDDDDKCDFGVVVRAAEKEMSRGRSSQGSSSLGGSNYSCYSDLDR